MLETLTEAEKRLKEFAEKEPKLFALYKGKDFEDGSDLYFFLTRSKYDPELEDRLSDLDLAIFDALKVSVNVTIWPSEQPENYGLTAENCIYKQ